MRDVWKHFDISTDNIVLSECGIQQFLPGQRYSYTVTENFVLHYIESGTGTVRINHKTYYSDSFNGYILKRGENVDYFGDEIDPWKTYWVGLTGSYFQDLLNRLQLSDADVIQFKEDSPIIRVIKEICHETEANPEISNYWYKSKTYELLLYLEQEFISNDFINLNMDPILGIYDFICKNYYKALNVDDLATLFGISRSNLFKQFKKLYHITPKQFILELRINKACQLLRETNNPIKTISNQVGFEEYVVFTKAFKRILQQSPTEYRKSGGQKEIHEIS
ncbi:hypothetical protein BU202_02390 [Streptococcus cuniculi]|uniref:HTH araC/xylS-type domain-containing protein n=1 Tax=Streptococcus cuniculi TaxID=1432788 RepID=A0A1Q8E9L7_9STRE|nr:AraC family transcriptional regulator [Streptococcus cuniculi]OLF48484.1 hypothetical protein BU202_02390 [Streptococcus cuniculi]